jgi:hypothetical protein
MAGKVCRVTKDSVWLTEIPNHEGYRLTPMINSNLCPGAQIEFYVGEFQPEVGRAVDHIHGKDFDVVGGETFRVIAIFSPPRAT